MKSTREWKEKKRENQMRSIFDRNYSVGNRREEGKKRRKRDKERYQRKRVNADE